jgi:hypothetical protein
VAYGSEIHTVQVILKNHLGIANQVLARIRSPLAIYVPNGTQRADETQTSEKRCVGECRLQRVGHMPQRENYDKEYLCNQRLQGFSGGGFSDYTQL